MKDHITLVLVLTASSINFAVSQAAPIIRLDFGTAGSPVAEGHRRVTARLAYDRRQGFGWQGKPGLRESFHRTRISNLVTGKETPPSQLVDGVMSEKDMVFQVDVPNGEYQVEVQIGDLGGFVPAGLGRFLDTGKRGLASGGPGGPLYGMNVQSGKRSIARNVATLTYPHRGIAVSQALLKDLGWPMPRSGVFVRLGNYKTLRFREKVTDGKIVLRFHGDDSPYRAVVQQIKKQEAAAQRRLLHLGGGPFTRNSVLALVVRPAIPTPIIEMDGRLSSREASPKLRAFIKAYHSQDWDAAQRAVDALPAVTFANRHARLLTRMWLVGHPNHWGEREMLPALWQDWKQAAALANQIQQAELDSLRDQIIDLERGIQDFDRRTRDGAEMVPAMNRAEGYFQRALPGEPFYWKAQLYRARVWYSMDPNRKSQMWPRSEVIMKELEKVYPRNRWARFYLHDDPSGWPVVDYRRQDAPPWATELHHYYNRMLDLCEWWIRHRQDPVTGAIGGEWGDDVEFMPLIAYTGFICPTASPLLVNGANRFCDGAWSRSGIVDTHNGFFHITCDAEHSAEFTGNILGMSMHLRPGDPVPFERALKTGKLMRDLWMGRNARGQRLVRSSYLGAFQVPNSRTDVDSAICGRAMMPALNLLQINRNPEIARLVVEYADALLELSQSTAKGKPAGVIPGPIVFATGELGHAGSKEWWLAPPDAFQGMFSFPSYHPFRLRILTAAWKLTGDARYLKPIQQEAELVKRYPNARRTAKPGSTEWVAASLARMGVAGVWNDIKAQRSGDRPETTGILLDKNRVATEARQLAAVARSRWPIMTDDATMTDRVGFRGCINPTIWYCGARLAAQEILPAVSYEGPSRDFAALVLRHNPRYLKLLYYSFQKKTAPVRLQFWELQPGGTYRLTAGPDADGDDQPDRITIDRTFHLNEPSGGIELKLPPGQTWAMVVQQTRPPPVEGKATDPAITADDIRFDPRGHLLVDVHNLGNLPAENVSVSFYDGDPDRGGKLLGQTMVSHLEPPNTLQPQVVRTGIEWMPSKPRHSIFVVLDREERIKEMFERNNRAGTVIGKP